MPTASVLAVIDSLGQGGAERSLLDLACETQKHGITTTVATLGGESMGFSAEDLGIERIRLGGSTPLGRLMSLRSLIETRRFDLVHTTLIASDITGRLAAWGTGVPVLSSIVNTTYDRDRLADPNVTAWKVGLIRAVDGWTARHLTQRLHAISDEVGESARRALGFPDSRIVVIPRGRDPEEFAPPSLEARDAMRRDMGLAAHASVFLAVGRQEHQKGHATLLEAWPAVSEALPEAVLLLAGRSGNESKRLAAMTDRLQIEDNVRFLGFRRDVARLLAVADVFVFPSRYEGLGGALLEAMAAQVPVVVTDLAVTREVLGDAGWFFPAGDVAALATALIAADESSDETIPAAALARFMERFTLEAVGSRMASLYEEIVDSSAREIRNGD